MSDDLINVYQADSLGIAEMIHQRLDEVGIDAFVEPTASPFDGLNVINQGPHIRVRENDASRAAQIIKDFLAEHADDADT